MTRAATFIPALRFLVPLSEDGRARRRCHRAGGHRGLACTDRQRLGGLHAAGAGRRDPLWHWLRGTCRPARRLHDVAVLSAAVQPSRLQAGPAHRSHDVSRRGADRRSAGRATACPDAARAAERTGGPPCLRTRQRHRRSQRRGGGLWHRHRPYVRRACPSGRAFRPAGTRPRPAAGTLSLSRGPQRRSWAGGPRLPGAPGRQRHGRHRPVGKPVAALPARQRAGRPGGVGREARRRGCGPSRSIMAMC